jgi:hypothetical protein
MLFQWPGPAAMDADARHPQTSDSCLGASLSYKFDGGTLIAL